MRLLEADTDGVYGAVPAHWAEADERRAVAEVAALLPPRVRLEFEGRYAAMLSHEPKNYALLGDDGALTLRGVAFRSSRAEPFGEAFLRAAIARLLVGDVPGVRGDEGQAVYAASKAAVIGLTLAAAKELAPQGIRVNAVAPGYIETDMIKGLAPEVHARRLAQIGLGRVGTATDVANLIAFLASDLAAYVTGQVIGVDGGMRL